MFIYYSFSTLQRVEIAEIRRQSGAGRTSRRWFQYSSTSRNCRNVTAGTDQRLNRQRFSTLQRVEIAEIESDPASARVAAAVSVLFNESKLPKSLQLQRHPVTVGVSVLFNESKLPKSLRRQPVEPCRMPFQYSSTSRNCRNQRVVEERQAGDHRFSTLQRVEIAEMVYYKRNRNRNIRVSVLFNESKLPKSRAD